ncbi:MAG TPA: Rrf2 family transcriptional regulator [Magnetospirillum sp.]|jgi:Rrf2 family nitric oxide-sensitive transcriptional repressor|nr:Rrf2 family transcriptional regulator [Magnetospirillum sp.]
MKITQFTDYSLRLMRYLAGNRDRVVTVREVAEYYRISAEHLKKVVRRLSELGYISTVRGKNGGLRLACEPETINLGRLMRQEENLTLLPCNDIDQPCPLLDCKLARVVDEALAAFLGVLDKKTLADLV